MSEEKYINALIYETSPYLLQHAHNPVQWYPWGSEALAKAKAEDKPILLSIGYSACHWCHVMAHECFEDEEIASLMNQSFINIKVDREERPDLDAIYMSAVQLTTGRGGWPMTVFLTPDQQPFFCGTYFPKEDRYGVPGFRRVLLGVAQAYQDKRQILYQDAGAITAELKRFGANHAPSAELARATLSDAANAIASGFDSVHGGFGEAPKFPPSMALSFLMRCSLRENTKYYLEIINKTLAKMAAGGMYDQLGGGFHRYSVDAQWLVPHFEKMLYDNALLSRVYLDGFLLTGNESYGQTCREVLDYVIREMMSSEGGFYSSQDADSEGGEGEYYIWANEEIHLLLGEEDSRLFCRYYGVTPNGNFEGKNILHIPKPMEEFARANNLSARQLSDILQRCRETLFEARERRVKPGRDEKILTAWNGLMLRSFAEASRVLDSEAYLQAAVKNAEFLLSKLYDQGSLLRSYKDGQAKFSAYLDDYSCLIDGLLSLYEATFEPRWVQAAEDLASRMVDKFWDQQERNFFLTPDNHEVLIHRPKEIYDNALPCGNSVAAGVLLRLTAFTGDQKWADYSIAVMESNAGLMVKIPNAFPHLLCVLDDYLGATTEIAIIGSLDNEAVQEFSAEVFRRYRPNKVVACGLKGGLALLENRPQVNGQATVYVCEGHVCKNPVNSVEELRKMLGEANSQKAAADIDFR
jgi:uncharacterized protein YyaL (SSP411 family)